VWVTAARIFNAGETPAFTRCFLDSRTPALDDDTPGGGTRVARCKVYEVQGPDPARTAGAVRCHRDVASNVTVNEKKFPVCKRHHSKGWELFMQDGWLYAVDRAAKRAKS